MVMPSGGSTNRGRSEEFRIAIEHLSLIGGLTACGPGVASPLAGPTYRVIRAEVTEHGLAKLRGRRHRQTKSRDAVGFLVVDAEGAHQHLCARR